MTTKAMFAITDNKGNIHRSVKHNTKHGPKLQQLSHAITFLFFMSAMMFRPTVDRHQIQNPAENAILVAITYLEGVPPQSPPPRLITQTRRTNDGNPNKHKKSRNQCLILKILPLLLRSSNVSPGLTPYTQIAAQAVTWMFAPLPCSHHVVDHFHRYLVLLIGSPGLTPHVYTTQGVAPVATSILACHCPLSCSMITASIVILLFSSGPLGINLEYESRL